MKYFVTEFHSIAPLMMAMQLADGHPIDEIEAIEIATYKFAYEEIGSGPENGAPRPANGRSQHALYRGCRARNGGFSDTIFDPARFTDAAVLRLADKIKITEDPELTRQLPHCFPCRMDMRFMADK